MKRNIIFLWIFIHIFLFLTFINLLYWFFLHFVILLRSLWFFMGASFFFMKTYFMRNNNAWLEIIFLWFLFGYFSITFNIFNNLLCLLGLFLFSQLFDSLFIFFFLFKKLSLCFYFRLHVFNWIDLSFAVSTETGVRPRIIDVRYQTIVTGIFLFSLLLQIMREIEFVFLFFNLPFKLEQFIQSEWMCDIKFIVNAGGIPMNLWV